LLLFFYKNILFAQKDTSKSWLFFSSGAGAVYSFFVCRYPNFPNSQYGEYTVDKKDWKIGRFWKLAIR
jgi:hypothetical protein